MRQGWEDEAANWAAFVPAQRRWQRIPLFLHLRAIKAITPVLSR
jgi:hypothetical protein